MDTLTRLSRWLGTLDWNWVRNWGWAYGFGPWVLPVAAICAICGAFILSRFTYLTGVFGFLVNFALLMCGALVANLLGAGLDLGLTGFLKKAILLSMLGITASGLIVLVVMVRPSRD